MAREHRNRGDDSRTRIPSVNALSEFSHNQGQPLTKIAAGADPEPLLVYPQKRTRSQGSHALKVPGRDSCTAAKRSLFEHFIGASKDCGRNG